MTKPFRPLPTPFGPPAAPRLGLFAIMGSSQQLHHLQQRQMLLQHQDSTPQDVLAEARKNLQVLIDSGLSKDLLHQWVDDSQSSSLAYPAPSFAPQSQPSRQGQLLLQQQHQQQTQPSDESPSAPLAPPPPPPQCPPPPPPSHRPASAVDSPAPSATPRDQIKTESIAEENQAVIWSSASSSTSTPSSAVASVPPHCVLPTVPESDPSAIFMPPQPPFSHRPRISVSSTSSGSSEHASIWSANSAHSSMSWQSASTCPRIQQPLPMPPGLSGGPVIGALPLSGTASGRSNVYWCTSCETSFKRKYDWKRHEDEFHERWRKYPCPEPGCNRSFWGSNSFNQHHKQCHGCKTCPHADKVVKFLRKRKYWACGFCSALHPARERHVEHVARHFESGLTKADWMHSRVVYGLLHQPLIHEAWDALVASKQAEYSGRRPQFSWHPSKTGRAQGFLEQETPGQLQDLLEFFSGDEGEAQWIVTVAHDLADIVLTSAPIQSSPFAESSLGLPQAFVGADPRMSFVTLPTPTPQGQPMMVSPDPRGSPCSFGGSFQAPMCLPSQPFAPTQQPSPSSSSHSPMAASQSPLDKRELPPPPPVQPVSEPASGGMDFEYSSAPIVFEDWDSLNSVTVDDSSSHSTGQGTSQDWRTVPYFVEPRCFT